MKNQEQLIKKVTKIGNGAHIFVPKEWVNEEVTLVRTLKPKLPVKKEIINILSDYTEDLLGIYLVGSFGRNEETPKSDVDVLVISNKINKKIELGRYNIIIISRDEVEKQLEKNILPLLPMIKEAKPIFNPLLIEQYKKTRFTKKNLDFHIKTTKSALKINKGIIKLDKELKSKCSDSVAYSLILRLRGVYILECLIKDKLWSNKEFLRLIKRISGSTEAYNGYLRAKNDDKDKKNLDVHEAEKILDYVSEKIYEQEKWAKRKK